MQISSKPPEPWESFLEELDGSLQESVDFHCIGGFVLTRLYGFERETRDVDVLSVTPNTSLVHLLDVGGKGSFLHEKHQVYLDKVTVIEAWPEELRPATH